MLMKLTSPSTVIRIIVVTMSFISSNKVQKRCIQEALINYFKSENT